jgi:hypothetical protein
LSFALALGGCNTGLQGPATPQWKTTPKEGVLRLSVYGGESDLERIAVGKLPASVPEAVFGDRLQSELSQHREMFPAGTTDLDLKAPADKCREAFRTVKQTPDET